jgi:hypothetical protein
LSQDSRAENQKEAINKDKRGKRSHSGVNKPKFQMQLSNPNRLIFDCFCVFHETLGNASQFLDKSKKYPKLGQKLGFDMCI